MTGLGGGGAACAGYRRENKRARKGRYGSFVVVRAVRRPRAGWDEAFAKAADADADDTPGGDELAGFRHVANDFDREEWTW